MITVVPLWAKSGLRSNLRASNLKNIQREHTSRPPYHVGAYTCIQRLRPPNLKCLSPPLLYRDIAHIVAALISAIAQFLTTKLVYRMLRALSYMQPANTSYLSADE